VCSERHELWVTVGYMKLFSERHELWVTDGYMKLCVERD
jgi:hypothetical protein